MLKGISRHPNSGAPHPSAPPRAWGARAPPGPYGRSTPGYEYINHTSKSYEPN